jgi:diacylglycerol kinase family enzyme
VISNLGAPAIEMKRGGPTGRAIATGDVLWKGACTLVAGSTTPHFGFGLKLFPFAGARGDRFHLRCGDAGWLDLLRGAPAAFRGEYFSKQIGDFLCDRVQIQLEDEVAIEAGGELLGRRRTLEIALGDPVIAAALGGDRGGESEKPQ